MDRPLVRRAAGRKPRSHVRLLVRARAVGSPARSGGHGRAGPLHQQQQPGSRRPARPAVRRCAAVRDPGGEARRRGGVGGPALPAGNGAVARPRVRRRCRLRGQRGRPGRLHRGDPAGHRRGTGGRRWSRRLPSHGPLRGVEAAPDHGRRLLGLREWLRVQAALARGARAAHRRGERRAGRDTRQHDDRASRRGADGPRCRRTGDGTVGQAVPSGA